MGVRIPGPNGCHIPLREARMDRSRCDGPYIDREVHRRQLGNAIPHQPRGPSGKLDDRVQLRRGVCGRANIRSRCTRRPSARCRHSSERPAGSIRQGLEDGGPPPILRGTGGLAYDETTPRAAFNRVADTIETTAVQNPVNAWMRKTSRRELLATFPAGAALLEIGCGTGADAIFLAERGYRVAALDISDRMVELARERVAARDLERNVVVWRGRLCDVETELAMSPWFPFDGAYANFSLAYEDSLRGVAQIVSALVKPGAWFVFSLPNKFCVSEPAVAFARLHFW